MKAIITVGVSGSGKSTFAKESDLFEINRDKTRWLVSGRRGWNGPNAYKFHSSVEDEVTRWNYDMIVNARANELDIIISDTNLNPKTRNKLIRQCTELGYEVEIKEFPISYQEALRRDKERGIYSVGEDVLYKQWEMWVQYWNEKED